MGAEPKLLLEGDFESFSIDEVLDVLGLSRQTMELVLEDDARTGTIVVRAGRVLGASAPAVAGRDAFHSLYRQPGRSFTVWYRSEVGGEPIGSLAELIAESRASARSSRVPVLEGSFVDHTIDEVLDVLSVSRQLLQLAVRRADGSTAAVVIKAGQVLGAVDERGELQGAAAFRAMIDEPGLRFEVVRLETAVALPMSLGTLAELLGAARRTEPPAEPRVNTLLEGSFEEWSLGEVLDVLAISRQTTEIVFYDADRIRGAIVVKAGRVLSAQVLGSATSGIAAFHDLYDQHGDRFVVLRRPNVRPGRPLATLAELVSSAERGEGGTTPAPPRLVATRPHGVGRIRSERTGAALPSPPRIADITTRPLPTGERAPSFESVTLRGERSLVLEGDFEHFTVDEVLDVMTLSRQAMMLRTYRGSPIVAELVIKAGRVLRAVHGHHQQPLAALVALRADPGQTFRVFRLLHRPPAPALGELVELMERARQQETALPQAPVLRALPPAPPIPPRSVAAPPPPPRAAAEVDEALETVRARPAHRGEREGPSKTILMRGAPPPPPRPLPRAPAPVIVPASDRAERGDDPPPPPPALVEPEPIDSVPAERARALRPDAVAPAPELGPAWHDTLRLLADRVGALTRALEAGRLAERPVAPVRRSRAWSIVALMVQLVTLLGLAAVLLLMWRARLLPWP